MSIAGIQPESRGKRSCRGNRAVQRLLGKASLQGTAVDNDIESLKAGLGGHFPCGENRLVELIREAVFKGQISAAARRGALFTDYHDPAVHSR